MILKSFAAKIWIIIIAWVVLAMLIFGGILAKTTHDYYYGYADEENEELTNAATSLASYLASLPSSTAVNEHFNFLDDILKYDFLATDSEGKVLVCTKNLRNWADLTMPGPDMARLNKGENVSFEGSTPEVNEHILKVATPIVRNNQILGAVFVIEPLPYLTAVSRSVNNSISWGLILSFLLAIPGGLLLARKVASPVVEMDRAVKDIATGNFDRLLHLNSNDELASLGQSVNTLSEEIRQQLQTVTRERQQLANILSSIEDGVLTLSPIGEIIIANRVAQKQFAKRIGESSLTLEGLPEGLRNLLTTTVTANKPSQGEFTFQEQIFSVETSPLLANQEYGGFVAVWHNVTKERQLETMRKEFVANVSHELRTPLSYLQGYTEALLDNIITDKAQRRRFLETILKETLRLRRLVNDLLDLNRIEFGGSLELPHEEVSVPTVISCIQQQISPIAEQKQVSFLLDIEPNLPLVNCGEDRLEQILLNLVDNALRFSPENGKIIISAKSRDLWVEISVTDQGCGIEKEDQFLIWNRFERGKQSRGSTTGSGLGLAIVKSLVQAYQGQVYLISEPGKGSIFSIRLPRI